MVTQRVKGSTGTINNALVDGPATHFWGEIRVLFGKRIRRRSDPGRPGQARAWLGAGAAAAVLGFHIVAARAQVEEAPILDQYLPPTSAGGGSDFQPGITVATRTHPLYEAPGVQFGTINLRPELNQSVGFDSNPIGLASPKGSPVIETQGQVAASMDLPLTSFRLSANVDNVIYTNLPNQNYTNWGITAGAEHQFGLNDLWANYSHEQLTILPNGLNTANITQPVGMALDDGQIAYRIQFGAGSITPGLQVDRFNFQNVPIAGTTLSQAINNRVVVTPNVAVGYEFATRRTAVLVIRDSSASYTVSAPGVANRDYNDLAILGGVDYDTDAVIRFRTLIGYERRTFSSNQFQTIQAPIFEATAIWTPTGLTTVTGTIARRIEAALENSTTGYTENYAQLRVDHEFLPNVLLYAAGGYYLDQYQDFGNQSLASVGVGGNWLLNRNMQLGASYTFVARTTGSTASETALGPSFVDHRFVVNLKLRL